MPIKVTTRPITPEEHARYTAPVTVAVTRSEALISLLGRGGCLVFCAGIGIGCFFSLSYFSRPTAWIVGALAFILTLIGFIVAWPLPSILFAAISGQRRVVHRSRLDADATIETCTVVARRVFTFLIDDSLVWLIETLDGQYLHVSGDDDDMDLDAAWIPGEITIQRINGRDWWCTTKSGSCVPYISVSEAVADALAEPLTSGFDLFFPIKYIDRFKHEFESDAASHATKHGTNPPAP